MNKSVKCTREDNNPWDYYTVAAVKTTPVSTKTARACSMMLKYLYNFMYKYVVAKVCLNSFVVPK